MEKSENDEDSLMKAIEYYQSALHRYLERNDESKMLHSLSKLSRYPIKVRHLKETGVGRTVNLLSKLKGKVSEEANSLIKKWKNMVDLEKVEEELVVQASQNHYNGNSEENHSQYEKSFSEIKSSDEYQNENPKYRAVKEKDTERHRSCREYPSNDPKTHESSDNNKHKSSHDEKKTKHVTEREHSSGHDEREKGERSSEEKDKENDKRREREKDRNSPRDRSHRKNGDKIKKEKDERSEKDHKSRREKDRSSHRKREEKTNKDNNRSEQKEKEERVRREEQKSRREKEEKTRREEEERVRREEEEKTRREEEERTRREEEEKTRREEERARREEKEKARREEKERARREEKEKARREEKEKARREEKEKARREEKEKTRREEKEKARKEEKEKARREEKEKARKEEKEKARKEEEQKTLREKDEKRKYEKSHKECDRKNEVNDKKDDDRKGSSSSSSKKDKISISKNHRTEISSESGTSFADALGMMEIPAKRIKYEKKESASKHHRSETESETPMKEKKTDKKESSSKSKHNKGERSPESGDCSKVADTPKKEGKHDKKEGSLHRRSEISSESGTSFEDALGMMEMPKKEKKSMKRDRAALYSTEIGSSSGTSFEAALGMMEEVPRKKKKFSDRQVERSPSPTEGASQLLAPLAPLESNDFNISSLLPSITPNYRPICGLSGMLPNDELPTLNSLITNKHHRTKIYSGNKSTFTKVPTLFETCVQLLQVHMDAIEDTGGVPYTILKPVLEKATPSQLLRLEYYNSYLTEESDELWQLHCQKDFRREKREECETWRDMYTRCTEERERRLLTLTANIKQSREKSVPVKQTKIAYIDIPNPYLSRKQARPLASAPMAKAKVMSIVKESKATSDVVVTHQRRAARGCSSAASAPALTPSQAAKAKRVAPLMAKSLSAFKNRFKR